MTKVKMIQRYIIWVSISSETGDVISASVVDNETLVSQVINMSKAPEFIAERIALLKLTDVNKSDKGESIGRKLSHSILSIYITYDEYQQLKEECK